MTSVNSWRGHKSCLWRSFDPPITHRLLANRKDHSWQPSNFLTPTTPAQKLLAGASKLARAVRSTLGPRGRNAVLDKGWGSPNVTKDGVTVAEDIELKDPFENMGAQLVKEAARKTSDVAGDGTTTATVLAEFIFREGLQGRRRRADPMALVRGIQKGVEQGRRRTAQARRADRPEGQQGDHRGRHHRRQQRQGDRPEARRGDEEGRRTDGVITIEEGKTAETEVNVVQGMQFDRGYLSPHFVTNQEAVTCEFENPYILIYEEKISQREDADPAAGVGQQAEGAAASSSPRTSRARRWPRWFSTSSRACCRSVAVKAPGYGDRRKAMLEDIAILTGGKADLQGPRRATRRVDQRSRRASGPTVVSYLGRAKKVKIDAENTTVTEGKGDQKAIEGRAEIDPQGDHQDRQRVRPREAPGAAREARRRRRA